MTTSPADAAAAAARALLASESIGLLSTISVRHAGTPYGSITPYALGAAGEPLLLLSGLAAHTHNLRADPRAGLFVTAWKELGSAQRSPSREGAETLPGFPNQIDRSAAADPQAGARVSLLGRMSPLPADLEPDARTRYLARWPQAAQYLALKDFTFWRFEIEEARLVAGFGEIRWLTI